MSRHNWGLNVRRGEHTAGWQTDEEESERGKERGGEGKHGITCNKLNMQTTDK